MEDTSCSDFTCAPICLPEEWGRRQQLYVVLSRVYRHLPEAPLSRMRHSELSSWGSIAYVYSPPRGYDFAFVGCLLAGQLKKLLTNFDETFWSVCVASNRRLDFGTVVIRIAFTVWIREFWREFLPLQDTGNNVRILLITREVVNEFWNEIFEGWDLRGNKPFNFGAEPD